MGSHGLVRWECDICHREFAVDNIKDGLGERAIQPEGWFSIHWMVNTSTEGIVHKDVLVCSLLCFEQLTDNFRER